jgi:hypothetical protein
MRQEGMLGKVDTGLEQGAELDVDGIGEVAGLELGALANVQNRATLGLFFEDGDSRGGPAPLDPGLDPTVQLSDDVFESDLECGPHQVEPVDRPVGNENDR